MGIVVVLVCVQTPYDFSGVGQWYQDFEPTSDTEVRELMKHAMRAYFLGVLSVES